jgi:hypothetical protein
MNSSNLSNSSSSSAAAAPSAASANMLLTNMTFLEATEKLVQVVKYYFY